MLLITSMFDTALIFPDHLPIEAVGGLSLQIGLPLQEESVILPTEGVVFRILTRGMQYRFCITLLAATYYQSMRLGL